MYDRSGLDVIKQPTIVIDCRPTFVRITTLQSKCAL